MKENIKTKLKQYAVAGIVPELLDLKYLYLEVTSKVYYNTNLAPSATFVSSVVQTNVTKYSESTELNKYGARLKYSKLLKLIDDSHNSVTSNITTIAMRRDLRLTLNTFVEYQIGFGNQFHIKSMSGYNIKSSGFTVAGIQETVYVSDIPDTNRRTGLLFFFTLPTAGSQSPTIVKRNVGFIDYEKGIITLNPVNMITVGGGSRVTTQTVGTIGGTTTSTSSVSTSGASSGGSSSYSSSSSGGSSSGGSSSY